MTFNEVEEKAKQILLEIWYKNIESGRKDSPEGFCTEFVEALSDAELLRTSIDK